MTAPLELVIIGAGISGLAFASTYLGVHPEADVVILEKETLVGGTWNRRRLYDHFWTQWSVGFGEFADQPMTIPPEEDQYCGLFKSKHTSRYLEEYAEARSYAGRNLKDRIRFSTIVKNAEKREGHWHLDIENTATSSGSVLTARKLIVASGITTVPSIPRLPGAETFTSPIIHNMDFGSSGVLADPAVKHITVLGGGKSGADMVYASVKAGKDVAWIVRPTGTGPCIFVGAKGKGPFNNAFELASTRAPEALQPSYFAGDSWWNWFLHRTEYGRKFVTGLFAAAHKEAVADADYENRPSRGDFSKLVPHTQIFWRNNAAGIVNHGDFYEVLAGSVDTYYDDVQSLHGKTITLASGRAIPSTDAFLLGTGWQNSLGFIPPALRAELGLPYPLRAAADFDADHVAIEKDWAQREDRADKAIVARYPVLGDPPEHVHTPITNAPHRLYNLMVPVDDPDRSFACIGLLNTTNYFRSGEAQSLWVTAYLDGHLSLPSVDARREEVAQFVAWNRRRYLSLGNDGNSVSFDTLRYTDRLWAQVGLKSHLQGKKAGFFGYFFSPNRASDYRGMREEYRALYPA